MRPLLTLFVVAATLVVVVPASTAGHCASYSTSDAMEVSDDHYLVVDAFGGVHLYEEKNGIEGLQRQDRGQDDTCHDSIVPDDAIF